MVQWCAYVVELSCGYVVSMQCIAQVKEWFNAADENQNTRLDPVLLHTDIAHATAGPCYEAQSGLA